MSSRLLPSVMVDQITGEMIGTVSEGPVWSTEEFLARERRFPGWDDDDEDMRRAEEVQRQEREQSERNTVRELGTWACLGLLPQEVKRGSSRGSKGLSSPSLYRRARITSLVASFFLWFFLSQVVVERASSRC